MQVICPFCDEIIEIDVLAIMEDGFTRCDICKSQISTDDLDPEIFKEMGGAEGMFKSASTLLKSEFDL